MAEIEITLPTVQYGNVKVKATPEAFGLVTMADAYELGVATAVYLNLFQQGFKAGAAMDVGAPQAASQPDPLAQVQEQAQKLLDEGLGGVTELDEVDQAVADLAVTKSTPPWNSTVDAKPKPWESGEAAPKAAVISSEW